MVARGEISHTCVSCIGAVILAAGKSERFGAPKIFQSFLGVPFFTRITDCLREAGIQKVVLVLGHKAEIFMPQLSCLEHLQVVINTRHGEGQFSSVQAGIGAGDASVAGVLLCLIDQPHLTADLYRALVQKALLFPTKIIIPSYDSRGGRPVHIPRRLFAEILAEPSTSTLRTVIQRYPRDILKMAVDEPGILEDIDTREDLVRLEKKIHKSL